MNRTALLIFMLLITLGVVSAQCVNLSNAATYGTKVVNVSYVLYVNEATTLCGDTYSINASASTAMLQINASNILLDCNNSILNGVTGAGYGIYMTAKENITISNCSATWYAYGMYAASSSRNVNITNNFMYNNTQREIALVGTSGDRLNNFTITNNRVWNGSQYGFYVDYMENSTFINNTAYINSYQGFYVSNSKGNIFENNNISNSTHATFGYGLWVYSSSYNNFTNNTLYGNKVDGLYLYFDNGYNIVENNTVNENAQNGFHVFNSVSTNFTGNVVNNTNRISSTGFYTSGCTGCRLANNYARNCAANGFSDSSTGIVLINNTIINSGGSGSGVVVFSSGCIIVNNTAINTSIGAAFSLSGVSNCNITGNLANVTVTGANCFVLGGSSAGANFSSNTAYGCAGSCFYISSNSVDLAGIAGATCTNYGLLLLADYVNVRGANLSVANSGFYTTSAQLNNITNIVTYANTYGFYLSGANVKNNTFMNVTTYNNSDTGIYIPSSSLDNRFINSSTHSNTKYGIYIYQGANLNGTNIHTYNNTLTELYYSPWGSTAPPVYIKNLTIDNPYGNFENYTSIDLLQSVAGGFGIYTIGWSSNTTTIPAGMNRSFAQKYINITNTTATLIAIDQMNFTWVDSELTGYTESLFRLWKYNNSGWALMDSTPDTASHALSMEGFTPGSIYGIFQAEPPGCANLSNDSTWGTMIVNNSGVLYVNENTTLCAGTYYINTSTYVLQFNASNIHLNCNASVLDGVDGLGTAIVVPPFESNTIENCTIANYSSGIYLSESNYSRVAFNNITHGNGLSVYSSNGSSIFNNSISDTGPGIWVYTYSANIQIYNNSIHNNLSASSQGIRVENSNSTLLMGNDVRNMSWECAWMADSAYGVISGNTFDVCGRYANVIFAHADGCNLTNNTITNATGAALVYMQDSSNSLVEGNEIAYGPAAIGIYATVATGLSDNNTLLNNSVHGASTGIYALYSNYSAIRNNTIYGNSAYGMYMYLAVGSVLEHNTFRDNGGYGISLDSCTSSAISNTTAYNNSNYGLYLASASTGNNFTNTFIYNQSYYILQQAAAALPNNFTNLTLGYNETIGLLNYPFLNATDMVLDSSDLILDPYFVSLDGATAPEANLSANITIYAANCSDPVLRAAGFPSTLADILTGGAIYPTSKFCAGDTASFNVSGFSGYALGREMTTLTLEASPSTPATVGNETNVSCYADNAEVTVEIFVNEVSAGSAVERFEYLQNLSVGFYNFTCNTTGNDNYTSANSTVAGYEVVKSNTTLVLTIPSSPRAGAETNVSCSASNADVNISLYRDGVEVANGTVQVDDVAVLPVGTYAYVCNTTGSENYTASSVDGAMTLRSAASSTHPPPQCYLETVAPAEVEVGSTFQAQVLRYSDDDSERTSLHSASVTIMHNGTVATLTTGTDGRVSFVPPTPGAYAYSATFGDCEDAEGAFIAVEAPAQETQPEQPPPAEQPAEGEQTPGQSTGGQPVGTEVPPTPECTLDGDCATGFECQNSSCVEATGQPAAQGEEATGAGTPSAQPTPAWVPLWAWLLIVIIGAGAYWYIKIRKKA